MKIFLKLLVLIFLFVNCFAERVPKAGEQGPYTTDPSKVFQLNELEPFYKAVVRLEFVYIAESNGIKQKYAKNCMGLLIAPNHIYTASHCLYNSNIIENPNYLDLRVYNPANKEDMYLKTSFKEVSPKILSRHTNISKDFLKLPGLMIAQNDILELTLPSNLSATFATKYLSPQKLLVH